MRNPSSDSHSQAGSNSPFLVKADTFEVFSQRNVWNQSWFLSLSLFWGFCLALFPNAMYWSMISHFLPHHHHRHQHPCEWNLPRSEFESRSPSSLSDKRRRPPNWIWWLGHHHLLASLVTIVSLVAWSPSSHWWFGHHHLDQSSLDHHCHQYRHFPSCCYHCWH